MTDTATSARAFAAGVVLGCTAATAAAYLWFAHPPKSVTEARPAGQPAAPASHANDASVGLDDVVLREQLTRNIQFFGEAACKKLWGSCVVVVGLGGVGSHAAHMLLRSGIRHLRLVDFDQVTLSSLNRHALATRADVGLPKATVLARHFHDICPEAHVEAIVAMYTREMEDTVLGGTVMPEFVLDAIDNLDTKVDLLAACSARGIPVLCVGGAGAKSDPTKLRFLDLARATVDPLVRSVRHQLRLRYGVTAGIDVLLSCERPRCGLVTTDEQAAAPSMLDYQTIPNFRIRSIPVLGTCPATFGMAAASWILCKLAGAPYTPEPVFTIQRPQYTTILEALQDEEEAREGHCEDIAVDLEEIMFLVSHVWRGLSAFQLGREDGVRDKGLHRRTAGLRLTRAQRGRSCTPDNLVLLTDEQAEELHAVGEAAWRAMYPEVAAFVDSTLARVAAIFGKL